MMVGGHRPASHLVLMRDRKIEQVMLLPLWVSKVDHAWYVAKRA